MNDRDLEDLSDKFKKLRSTDYSENQSETQSYPNMALTNEQLKAIVEGAVANALAVQEQSFNQKLQEVREELRSVTITTPEVETYKDAEIRLSVSCSETLDIMKSLPEFEGKTKHTSHGGKRHIPHIKCMKDMMVVPNTIRLWEY